MRASMPVAIAVPGLAACVSLVGVAALLISDPSLKSDPYGLSFVVLVGTFCGVVASVYWFLWVLSSAGRVRYYVDGTSVVVCRGTRTVARRDMSAATLVRVDGWINLRRGLLRVGPRWPSSSGLPHVFFEERSPGRFRQEHELPDVFIWGRSGADEFRQRLYFELRKAGIGESVFSRADHDAPKSIEDLTKMLPKL